MNLINRENFKKLMLEIAKETGINMEKDEHLDQVIETICLLEEIALASKMQETCIELMLQKQIVPSSNVIKAQKLRQG